MLFSKNLCKCLLFFISFAPYICINMVLIILQFLHIPFCKIANTFYLHSIYNNNNYYLIHRSLIDHFLIYFNTCAQLFQVSQCNRNNHAIHSYRVFHNNLFFIIIIVSKIFFIHIYLVFIKLRIKLLSNFK